MLERLNKSEKLAIKDGQIAWDDNNRFIELKIGYDNAEALWLYLENSLTLMEDDDDTSTEQFNAAVKLKEILDEYCNT